MLGSALTLLAGVLLVMTMPSSEAKEGATAVIGVLGIGFTAVAIISGAIWIVRNRQTIRRIFLDIIDAQ